MIYGDVVQMVERSLSMREVRGSMPRISISFHLRGGILYFESGAFDKFGGH